MPDGYGTTGFCYRGYDIYLKVYKNHLLFYTVDKSTASPHPAGRHGLGEYYQTMDQQKTLNILRKESPDS